MIEKLPLYIEGIRMDYLELPYAIKPLRLISLSILVRKEKSENGINRVIIPSSISQYLKQSAVRSSTFRFILLSSAESSRDLAPLSSSSHSYFDQLGSRTK